MACEFCVIQDPVTMTDPALRAQGKLERCRKNYVFIVRDIILGVNKA